MPTEDDPRVAAALLSGALGDLHRLLRRSASRRAGRSALPDAQVEVLRLVQRRPGLTVKEAAESLCTAANTVSTLVGDLVDAGLLDRHRDPENRRLVRLTLTEAARERIADYGRHRADLLLAALDRLDPAGRRDLVRAAPALRALADAAADEDRATGPGTPGGA